MPQIQSIYNGNFVVWQRKLAEIVIDLKSDVINLQNFGLIIAESTFFNSTANSGIHVTVDVATHLSPTTWNSVYSAPLVGSAWAPDMDNMVPAENGVWTENKYLFNNGAGITGRYIRYRIAADNIGTPLQTLALKKVILSDSLGNSLVGGASVQVNALGWQTGNVLKDILEDLLEGQLLGSSLQDEVIAARVSPKGTWNEISENYVAPIPKIFTSLKGRLDDLELDAERRLSGRKLIIPVEDTVSVIITQSVLTTNVQADAPYRKIMQYLNEKDIVDVLVQANEGIGSFEEPLRTPDGTLVVGRVSYGSDTPGYIATNTAKVTLYRTDTSSVYSMPAPRTLKLVLPVETDLWHMDKHDLTRGHFATDVIQDIGVLNAIDKLKKELSDAITSDSVNQLLIVYQQSGSFYADLVFPSNATNTSGWVVLKNGSPATPGTDYAFISNRKIRLDTHDNSAPTSWGITYFTATQASLDNKINELVEAIARLTVMITSLASNIDEINDALVMDSHSEVLQFDYSGNDGYDYFKPLTYSNVRNIDNAMAVMYQNGLSIGVKDTVWVFRGDGIVALHRASLPHERESEFSIKYYFRKHDRLVNKIQEITRTTDRDLIARNWAKTNPVPPEADSGATKLI